MAFRIALLTLILAQHATGSANIYGDSLKNLIEANTEFAFELYRDIANQGDGKNIVYSPFSISIALAMLKLGTAGNSTAEIDAALHLSDVETSLVNSAFGELNGLLFDKPQENVTLKGANGVFISKKQNMLSDYRNALSVFGAEMQEVDPTNPKESANSINKWIAEKTDDRISDMVTEDSMGGMQSLVLANTLYFTGDWHSGFNPRMTDERAFYVSHYKVIKTPFMFQRGKFKYAYIKAESLHVLELPYVGQEISMTILLPDDFNLERVEKILNYGNLIEWTKEMQYVTVDVTMPKFKIEEAIDLQGPLQRLGVTSIFDSSKADLSGISGDKSLFVDKILHKGVLEVQQHGGVVLAEREEAKQTPRSEMKMVYADHPFTFAIRNVKTNVLYVLGAIKRPAGREVAHDEL